MLKVGRPEFGSLAESGQKTLKVVFTAKGVGRKFLGGPTEKRPKNSKKTKK